MYMCFINNNKENKNKKNWQEEQEQEQEEQEQFIINPKCVAVAGLNCILKITGTYKKYLTSSHNSVRYTYYTII